MKPKQNVEHKPAIICIRIFLNSSCHVVTRSVQFRLMIQESKAFAETLKSWPFFRNNIHICPGQHPDEPDDPDVARDDLMLSSRVYIRFNVILMLPISNILVHC